LRAGNASRVAWIVALVLRRRKRNALLDAEQQAARSVHGRPLVRLARSTRLGLTRRRNLRRHRLRRRARRGRASGAPRSHRSAISNTRKGMAASLRAGLRQAPDADGVVVLLGDMPLISPGLIDRSDRGVRVGGARRSRRRHAGDAAIPCCSPRPVPARRALVRRRRARALLRAARRMSAKSKRTRSGVVLRRRRRVGPLPALTGARRRRYSRP